MFFINPEIISKSEKMSMYEEGCLSIPNQFAKIQRPDSCRIKYLDFSRQKARDEGRRIIIDLYST